MSLRYQLNVSILLAFIGIVLLRGSITIWQTRNAVKKSGFGLWGKRERVSHLSGEFVIQPQHDQSMKVLVTRPLP